LIILFISQSGSPEKVSSRDFLSPGLFHPFEFQIFPVFVFFPTFSPITAEKY